MGDKEIEEFITHLAIECNVAISAQYQALSAILFLYRNVLEIAIKVLPSILQACRPKYLRTVLTHREAMSVIETMQGKTRLMARLLYGSGLRLMECIRLRIMDIDSEQRQIVVRDVKGQNDRVTILPEIIFPELKIHLEDVKVLQNFDLRGGFGEVSLPFALSLSNIPMQEWNGDGNLFFLHLCVPTILPAVTFAGTILMKVYCKGQFAAQPSNCEW